MEDGEDGGEVMDATANRPSPMDIHPQAIWHRIY